MKIVLLVIGILLIVFIAFQLYTSMVTGKSESQRYKVVKEEDGFEIRFYPSATMATITSSAKSYKELGNSGFSKLAGYIFGGNSENKQIPMTAPVHMNIGDSVSSMGFVMPSSYNESNLPLPNNPEVTIKTAPEEYVAVITFSGFASNEKIKEQSELLERYLKQYQLSYYGHFRYLGYNPPYQLFGRKNEIIVSLNWPLNVTP